MFECHTLGALFFDETGRPIKPAQHKYPIIIGTCCFDIQEVQEQCISYRNERYKVNVWNEIADRNNYELEWQVSNFSLLKNMLDNEKITTISDIDIKRYLIPKRFSFINIPIWGEQLTIFNLFKKSYKNDKLLYDVKKTLKNMKNDGTLKQLAIKCFYV